MSTMVMSETQARARARRRTYRVFREFLIVLDDELALYGISSRKHDLTKKVFSYIEGIAKNLRDEYKLVEVDRPREASVSLFKSHHQPIIIALLDLSIAWDSWIASAGLSWPERRLHESILRDIKGTIKGWRSYLINLELPDPPAAAPKPLDLQEARNGEIRSME